MLDIGAMELFVVAILALVVVGPRELPKLLRTVGGFMRKARELAAEFRSGVEELASEVEREVDPFGELRKEEGLRPGMSPQQITEHIMSNRDAAAAAANKAAEKKAAASEVTSEATSDSTGPAPAKKVKSKPKPVNPKPPKPEGDS